MVVGVGWWVVVEVLLLLLFVLLFAAGDGGDVEGSHLAIQVIWLAFGQ